MAYTCTCVEGAPSRTCLLPQSLCVCGNALSTAESLDREAAVRGPFRTFIRRWGSMWLVIVTTMVSNMSGMPLVAMELRGWAWCMCGVDFLN